LSLFFVKLNLLKKVWRKYLLA